MGEFVVHGEIVEHLINVLPNAFEEKFSGIGDVTGDFQPTNDTFDVVLIEVWKVCL